MADFLFEIGLEEVPARMIAGAEAELLRRTLAMLGKEALLDEGFNPLTDAKSFSTPRRLAVLVRGVREQQADVTEEVTGPAVKIAFKDGVATPAAEAFARKSGVSVGELKTVQTPKGEYLAATSVKKGRSAAAVIASELPKEVAAIYWAKNMYWRAGKPERFVRPVLWMVCLLGDAVVPVEFAGKIAGRASFGHRVMSSGEAFEVVAPESYVAQLEGEYVIADVEVRRQKIRKALDKVTRDVANARWREDEALVDAVTHLTEWPDVLLGEFEGAYLELPEEVLVTVMRDHQKYFAVDDASGKLAAHFLAVLNIGLTAENAPIIKQGNERVLRARFNDARFFWEFDQRTPLAERVKLLENVTFQKDLGSYAKKSERVRELCHRLAQNADLVSPAVDVNAILDAASLAKTDLTTELVKEFTELQGIIGGLYAERQRVRPAVAHAIYDQYMPASMEDRIPRSIEGAVLGIADRADTIAGMFGLGLEPTGSKDPFALRRAANAIVKILAESELRLPLESVITSTITDPDVADKVRKFLRDRLEFYLKDVKGFTYDTVAAVIASSSANPNWGTNLPAYNDVPDTVRKCAAIEESRSESGFRAVCKSFKRLSGIYKQASSEAGVLSSFNDIFASELEASIWAKIQEAGAGYLADCQFGRYSEALTKLSNLGPAIAEYFDNVHILVEDPLLRFERLSLVRYLLVTFTQIADFSEIVTTGTSESN